MEPPDLNTCAQDPVSRLRAIRDRLPGQQLRERIDTARAAYGPTYTLVELRQKVAESLPQRLGFTRGTALDPIEQYRDRIPDAALLKYDDAAQSGLFSKFWIATPMHRGERRADPSIIGEVAGSELCAVVAHWAVSRHGG